MFENVAYIGAAMLFPLVPAYILYRNLPARTTVKGPFKGLDIQLSGAFAGYFLLVLVVFAFVYSRPKPIASPGEVHKFDVYKVEGKINIAKQKELEDVRLSLIPPERAVEPNGKFEFEIPVKPDQIGEPTFPSLIIEQPQYETATVDLKSNSSMPAEEKYHFAYNKETKTVTITDPILLRRKDADPPFSPQRPPPINPFQQ